jgi:hypothetical protein
MPFQLRIISGGTSSICPSTSTTLTASGGTTYLWSSGATTASITVSPTITTTYSVTVTLNGCTATASRTVTVTPCGSVGNYVWIDTNNDGLQNEAVSSGLNGIEVQLWSPGANGVIGGGDDVWIATTLTANNGGNPGFYNFNINTTGNYFIKFPITTTDGRVLTTANTTATTDNNSDANSISGFSPIFNINVAGTGTARYTRN